MQRRKGKTARLKGRYGQRPGQKAEFWGQMAIRVQGIRRVGRSQHNGPLPRPMTEGGNYASNYLVVSDQQTEARRTLSHSSTNAVTCRQIAACSPRDRADKEVGIASCGTEEISRPQGSTKTTNEREDRDKSRRQNRLDAGGRMNWTATCKTATGLRENQPEDPHWKSQRPWKLFRAGVCEGNRYQACQ